MREKNPKRKPSGKEHRRFSMSVRVYFKDDIRKCPSFRQNPGESKRATVCEVVDIYRTEDNRWYYHLSSNHDRVHPDLVGLVDEVSIRSSLRISNKAIREAGIYRHKTAQGEVEAPFLDTSRNTTQNIAITAKNLEDALELLERIKAGEIRPETSYESTQSGMSRAELVQALATARADLRTLAEMARTRGFLLLGRAKTLREICARWGIQCP